MKVLRCVSIGGRKAWGWGALETRNENCGTDPPRASVLSVSKIFIYSSRPEALGSSPGTNKTSNYRCWLIGRIKMSLISYTSQ